MTRIMMFILEGTELQDSRAEGQHHDLINANHYKINNIELRLTSRYMSLNTSGHITLLE